MPFTYPQNPFYIPYYLANKYGPRMFRNRFPRHPFALQPKKRGKKKPNRGAPVYVRRPRRTNRVNIRHGIAGGFGRRSRFVMSSKQKMYKLGVGTSANHYDVYNDKFKHSAWNSRVFWSFLDPSHGLNKKSTFDRIYTNEAFADSDNKIVVINQQVKAMIRNMTDHKSTLTAYTVRIHRTTTQNPNTIIAECMTDLGATASGTYNFQHGLKPWMSDRFKRYFKIVGSKQYRLGPGDTVTHSLVSKRPFVQDYTYKQDNTARTNLRGEYMILLKLEGDIVHDGITDTLIGTSTAFIDGFFTSRTIYRVPSSSEKNVLFEADDLEETFGGGAQGPVDEDIAISTIET